MAGTWHAERPPDEAWKAPAGMTRAERATEQDLAAGSRRARTLFIGRAEPTTASISLRMPQPGRRVYAYVRWCVNGRTIDRYVGEVSGTCRADYLADGWRQAISTRLLPQSLESAQASNSWASSPAVRRVMQANPRRDTKPERALRAVLHSMGLRYRVDQPPLPGMRSRADIVFSRAKLAVFVDGCFWHGCPDHYRPTHKNFDFWNDKLAENKGRDRRIDAALLEHGWEKIRVWEHEDPGDAAMRVAMKLRQIVGPPVERRSA